MKFIVTLQADGRSPHTSEHTFDVMTPDDAIIAMRDKARKTMQPADVKRCRVLSIRLDFKHKPLKLT